MLSSGAFGAALTANLMGIPAIAVSIDGAGNAVVQWEAAAATLQAVICGQAWDTDASPLLYNINVPNRPLAELKKLQTTSPSSLLSQYHHYVSATSERSVRITRVPDDRPAEMHPGSDAWAVAFGHVSLTPIRFFADVLAPITRGHAAAPGSNCRAALPGSGVGRATHHASCQMRSTCPTTSVYAHVTSPVEGFLRAASCLQEAFHFFSYTRHICYCQILPTVVSYVTLCTHLVRQSTIWRNVSWQRSSSPSTATRQRRTSRTRPTRSSPSTRSRRRRIWVNTPTNGAPSARRMCGGQCPWSLRCSLRPAPPAPSMGHCRQGR